jgi:hypothetical protein
VSGAGSQRYAGPRSSACLVTSREVRGGSGSHAEGELIALDRTAARTEQIFAWQSAYSAFSVSQSNSPAVIRYIANQKEHHRRLTFQEEYLKFLKKHRIDYDERYIWG